MLEANALELEGSADTPLAHHVRGCERCRAVAGRWLEEQAALAEAIAGVRPGVGADAAVGRLGRRSRSGIARRARWLVPLAAAAALAGAILLHTVRRSPELDPARPGEVAAEGPDGVSVEAPAGRDVLVFETDDPAITVVWFF